MSGCRSEKLAWFLFCTAIVAYVVLSAPMLLQFGIPYDAPSGPAIAKLHPATYLLILSWLVALAGYGNPLRMLVWQLRCNPLLAASFGCMVLVFVWVVWRHGSSGAAFIIEALWTPCLALFVLNLLEPKRSQQIVLVIVVLLMLNAVAALGEIVTHKRVAYLGKIEAGFVEPYFRASSLLGHPLHNALITVSLLPVVVELPWSFMQRLAVGLLLIFAILAFGGRSSLVIGCAVYVCAFVVWALRNVVRGRFNYLQLTGGSLFVMLGATALVAFVAITGLGERIFVSLQLDSSADVRFRVWSAFSFMSTTDLWIGIPPAGIDRVSLLLGLDPVFEAIENFWIYLLMQFGILGFIPFLAGLGSLLWLLWRSATVPMRLGLVVYMLVASTNNTLAAKTISLALLAVVMVGSATLRHGTVVGRVPGGAQ